MPTLPDYTYKWLYSKKRYETGYRNKPEIKNKKIKKDSISKNLSKKKNKQDQPTNQTYGFPIKTR